MSPQRIMRDILTQAADLVERAASLGILNEQGVAHLAEASRLIEAAAGTVGGHLKAVDR